MPEPSTSGYIDVTDRDAALACGDFAAERSALPEIRIGERRLVLTPQ